MELLIRLNHSY